MRHPPEMERCVANAINERLVDCPPFCDPYAYALQIARAAIRAIREPTQDMIFEGGKAYSQHRRWLENAGRVSHDGPAPDIWQAMIDKASPEIE